ncbi:hypothetical protein AGMMS49940_18040 [Spirochaetia bacterium]|nr:hypothetical protein AGMMS49940_18040 [Spirochaetia bacterium]
MIEGSIFLLLIPYLKSFYDMITSGMELWFIRGYLGSEEGRLSYVSGSILIRFIDPIVISLIITAYYKFNLKGKRYSDKASLLFTLLAVVALGLISGGGRTVVLNWLIIYMLFVCFYFNKKTRIFLNKNAKINLFILGVPILAGIVMTILRGIVEYYNENSIIKLLARSYTFFPALFDYYLKNPDKSGFFSSNTFGLSTFENIFLLMQYPFRLISGASASGESSYLFNYQLVTSITQVNRLIGPHFLTNAQVSMYFFFFRDWGYLGIFIGPWMLAFFLNKMYEFALKDRINFLFYVYTLSQLIRTTNVSPFSKTDYLTAFIFFLLFKKFVLTKRKLAIEIEGKA